MEKEKAGRGKAGIIKTLRLSPFVFLALACLFLDTRRIFGNVTGARLLAFSSSLDAAEY